ncbi:hypothetical protein [uncultured Kocuria sp.]|uniref:hypothetical protein n=1 Tax=uncultured Kocuria sp. TaxID=259305 RepID=UPI002596E908|nr:hypothetical protein [uncultured Kocuria sp.]MCT1367590.1 hypothetical protein [Rothia sp. p3-SID1597]
MAFEPVSLKYALSGSVFIGALNAVPVFVAILLLNLALVRDSVRLTIGSLIVTAILIGVLGTCLTTLMNRHEQAKQQKTMPHGPVVAVTELAGMTIAGAVVTPLFGMDPQFIWVGAAAGLLGSLPSFFVLSPWKESESEEDFQRRNKAFGNMTRETAQEYKEELRQKQQDKLEKKHGDPWNQGRNQGWWK